MNVSQSGVAGVVCMAWICFVFAAKLASVLLCPGD